MSIKKPNKIKLSIVIPVLNECTSLSIMLKFLKASIDVSHEVLIVYDSLNDTSIPTIKLMQKSYLGLKGIHNKLGRGVPNAIKSGVNASTGDFILIFTADDMGPVPSIKDMISLMDDGCDLVGGTRYAYGGKRIGGSIIGSILSRIGNKTFRLLSGSVFTDSTEGVMIFKKSIFNQMKIESKDLSWAVAFEISIKAQGIATKLGEVPMVSIDRLYGGESSFSLGPWLKEYIRWYFYGIKKLLAIKKRPTIKIRIPSAIKAV